MIGYAWFQPNFHVVLNKLGGLVFCALGQRITFGICRDSHNWGLHYDFIPFHATNNMI